MLLKWLHGATSSERFYSSMSCQIANQQIKIYFRHKTIFENQPSTQREYTRNCDQWI